MNTQRERILLVESNQNVIELIARQTLLPMGYYVEVVGSAATAILDAARLYPELIIANIKLPGLSGKDLLVALASQGMDIPVILIAGKGMESDVIQAFRLGAADYLIWPVREAEIVAAVERVLKQVRNRRERETLAKQLNKTNQELQRRVRELTTIFAVGKAVTSITSQASLLEKIVEGAMYTAEADCGWMMVRDGNQKIFVLGAQRGLPDPLPERVGQPWDDGISSLVALSGEPLSIHGESLRRFKVSRLGQSVLVMPVKVKNEVVGLLTLVRRAPKPFGESVQALLGAVADYASISVVNARLFKELEERARSLQLAAEHAATSERKKDELLSNLRMDLTAPLKNAGVTVKSLLRGEETHLNANQMSLLRSIQENLETALAALDAALPEQKTH